VQFEIPSRLECTEARGPGEICPVAGMVCHRNSKKINVPGILLMVKTIVNPDRQNFSVIMHA
jgi:hypothetical protein